MDCETNSHQARLDAESLGFTAEYYAFQIWGTCLEILQDLEPGEQPSMHYWDCYDWLIIHGNIEPFENHDQRLRIIVPLI